MTPYVLHNFFRSSTSYRVRAALALKGLEYDYTAYALRKGEQYSARHLALNPQGLVPTLETPNGPLSQSLAIIEWLDEVHPEPPLLPGDAFGRARVRSLAQVIALDVHPLNNLRVLKYIAENLGADEEDATTWFRHWVAEAFTSLEKRLTQESQTGSFCHGELPTLADICLAGQVINNRRFDVPMNAYPTINRIFENCIALPAFQKAAPENQPDAA